MKQDIETWDLSVVRRAPVGGIIWPGGVREGEGWLSQSVHPRVAAQGRTAFIASLAAAAVLVWAVWTTISGAAPFAGGFGWLGFAVCVGTGAVIHVACRRMKRVIQAGRWVLDKNTGWGRIGLPLSFSTPDVEFPLSAVRRVLYVRSEGRQWDEYGHVILELVDRKGASANLTLVGYRDKAMAEVVADRINTWLDIKITEEEVPGLTTDEKIKKVGGDPILVPTTPVEGAAPLVPADRFMRWIGQGVLAFTTSSRNSGNAVAIAFGGTVMLICGMIVLGAAMDDGGVSWPAVVVGALALGVLIIGALTWGRRWVCEFDWPRGQVRFNNGKWAIEMGRIVAVQILYNRYAGEQSVGGFRRVALRLCDVNLVLSGGRRLLLLRSTDQYYMRAAGQYLSYVLRVALIDHMGNV